MLQRAHTMEWALVRLRWFAGALVLVVEVARAYVTATPLYTEVALLVGIAFAYNVAISLYLKQTGTYEVWIGYLTSGIHTVLVALGLLVTGGLQSIFMPVLVLVILGASIRFPARISLPLSVAITATWAVIMLAGGAVGPGDGMLLAAWAVFLPVMNLFVRHLASEEEVQRQDAHRDYLTGLANQRALEASLADLVQEGRRRQRTFGVVLVDLIEFKTINDAHGLMAGDEALKFVARRLLASVREETDLVARWGGDEFAVLLPGADELTATKIIERVREELAAGLQLANGQRVRLRPRFAMNVYAQETTVREIMSWADGQLVYAKRQQQQHVGAT